jgi:hypothetical protein
MLTNNLLIGLTGPPPHLCLYITTLCMSLALGVSIWKCEQKLFKILLRKLPHSCSLYLLPQFQSRAPAHPVWLSKITMSGLFSLNVNDTNRQDVIVDDNLKQSTIYKLMAICDSLCDRPLTFPWLPVYVKRQKNVKIRLSNNTVIMLEYESAEFTIYSLQH